LLPDGVLWSNAAGEPLVQVKALSNVGRVKNTDLHDPLDVAAEISSVAGSRCDAWKIASGERIPITEIGVL
jgi:hypothetical protein